MCVGCVQVALEPQPATHSLHSQLHQIVTVQGLLKMGESRLKHVEALTVNKHTKESVSSWCLFVDLVVQLLTGI
jgi:hypothetical protein